MVQILLFRNFRYLLENGADVAAVNYDGELPVDIAESDKMEELLQKIIDEKGLYCLYIFYYNISQISTINECRYHININNISFVILQV